MRGENLTRLPSVSSIGGDLDDIPLFQSASSNVVAVVGVFFALILCVILLDSIEAHRTVALAGLFAPLGVLLRWKLMDLNDSFTIQGKEWLFVGTFTANFLACVLGLVLVVVEHHLLSTGDRSFSSLGVTRAIRTGFTGALSSVSMFALESFKLDGVDRLYHYVSFALGTCFAATFALWMFAGGL